MTSADVTLLTHELHKSLATNYRCTRSEPVPPCFICAYQQVWVDYAPKCHLQDERMKKAVNVVADNFNTMRTGRANPAILDRIQVSRLSLYISQQEHTYTLTTQMFLPSCSFPAAVLPDLRLLAASCGLGIFRVTSTAVRAVQSAQHMLASLASSKLHSISDTVSPRYYCLTQHLMQQPWSLQL